MEKYVLARILFWGVLFSHVWLGEVFSSILTWSVTHGHLFLLGAVQLIKESIWKPMCLTCCLPLFWIWAVQSLNCSTRKKGTRFFVHPESSLTIKLIFKAWLVCGVPGVSRNWARIVSCVSGGFDASNIQLKDTMVQDTAWAHLARCHSVHWALWEEEKLAGKVTSVTFWLVGTFEGGC